MVAVSLPPEPGRIGRRNRDAHLEAGRITQASRERLSGEFKTGGRVKPRQAVGEISLPPGAPVPGVVMIEPAIAFCPGSPLTDPVSVLPSNSGTIDFSGVRPQDSIACHGAGIPLRGRTIVRTNTRALVCWLVLGWSVWPWAVRADDANSSAAQYNLFDPVPDGQMRPFCTDRPTKGTGPCTIDAGHIQIESDILNVTFQNSGGVVTDTWVYTSPNVKLGITDNTDVELNVSPFVGVEVHDHRTGQRSEFSGFGDMFLRVKTSLVGNGAGSFSAAFDPYVKLPTAPVGVGNGAVEEGAVVPLQFALSDVWSLSVVPEVDVLKNADDDGRHAAGVVALGITRALSAQLGATAEYWINENGDPTGAVTQDSFDVAATWQPPGTTDLQFDVGANFGLNRNTPAAQLYFGISHRF